MAPDIMLLRMKIRINIVRCIDVNKIEITVLSARVLDALSVRGLKAKTVREFERYGTRRIVQHCLDNGQTIYFKETVQDFVWQERARMESGALPHYQWVLTRRAAVYLDQMAKHGKIQGEPPAVLGGGTQSIISKRTTQSKQFYEGNRHYLQNQRCGHTVGVIR